MPSVVPATMKGRWGFAGGICVFIGFTSLKKYRTRLRGCCKSEGEGKGLVEPRKHLTTHVNSCKSLMLFWFS